MDPIARRWAGRGPWDEVWFIELDAGPERSVWIRYTLADGPHRRGLSTWVIATDGDRVLADQGRYRLEALLPMGALQTETLALTGDRARGEAGDASWSLDLQGGSRAHRVVPALVERLGIGRTYAPAVLDLTATGELRIAGEVWSLDGARGVLGHIWGARNRTRRWAWAHAAVDDLVFEALSAELGPLPALTSVGLWIGDRHVDASAAWQLARATSTFHEDGQRWSFVTRSGGVTLRGTLSLPASGRVATVRYVDPGDGAERTCRNSGLSTLELEVSEGGTTRAWRTEHAAFELATRGPPRHPVVLSD